MRPFPISFHFPLRNNQSPHHSHIIQKMVGMVVRNQSFRESHTREQMAALFLLVLLTNVFNSGGSIPT
jgi:hypothetical protein